MCKVVSCKSDFHYKYSKQWLKSVYRDKFLPAMYNRFVYASLLRLILEGYFEVCISSIPVIAYVRLNSLLITNLSWLGLWRAYSEEQIIARPRLVSPCHLCNRSSSLPWLSFHHFELGETRATWATLGNSLWRFKVHEDQNVALVLPAVHTEETLLYLTVSLLGPISWRESVHQCYHHVRMVHNHANLPLAF